MMSGVLAFASDSAILLVPSSAVLNYLLFFKLSFAESSVRKLEDKLVQHRLNGGSFSFLWISLISMDGERCQVHFPGTFVLLTPHCRAKGQLTGPTVQQKKFPDCIIDVNHQLFCFIPPITAGFRLTSRM